MAVPIDPVRVEPVGDDQPWKRDQMRFNADVIAVIQELRSQVETLQNQVG